ncbi:hypothetical protein Zmor_014924 [Zophobas morio]|uniref:Uncharacterized protein n=1 Tax=Zophobas morio TaxID=2755281 RepID=A0AA38IDE8_9CUCU|nr:hypothetical protein Zmor_014924 [Zophobas morio]
MDWLAALCLASLNFYLSIWVFFSDHHLQPGVNRPGADFRSLSPSSVTLSEILASLGTSPPPRPISVPASELSLGVLSTSPPPPAPFPMMPGYFPMVAPALRY